MAFTPYKNLPATFFFRCPNFLLLFLVWLPASFIGQNSRTTDSLLRALHSIKTDSSKALLYEEIIESFSEDKNWLRWNDSLLRLSLLHAENDPGNFWLQRIAHAYNNQGFNFRIKGNTVQARLCYEKSLAAEIKSKDSVGIAAVLNNLGYLYSSQGNAHTALNYYNKSLAIRIALNEPKLIAQSYNNMSRVYSDLGDIKTAIDFLMKTLKLLEKSGERKLYADALNNLGAIYHKQGDWEKALELYKKSGLIMQQENDLIRYATNISNIGGVYRIIGKQDSALFFYEESLRLREKIGDKKGIASSLNNIAYVYRVKNQFEPAMKFFQRSLALREEINDRQGIANTLSNMAGLCRKQNLLKEAEQYGLRALEISKELGFPEIISAASETLYHTYKQKNQPKLALEYFELYIKMKDSILSTETKKASLKTQLKYEYEKKSAADSVKNAEMQKVKDARLMAQNVQIKQEQFQRYSLVIGLCVVLCGLLFVINRFRVTSKQKKIIEEQKLKVDEAFAKLHEKNKEVMDSIYYARRIQRALMPVEKHIQKKLAALRHKK